MELLNFLLILAAGVLVLRSPRRENLAFGLLVASALLTALLFFVGTRTSILPPVNY
jgi:lipopolysaccharide export LptBFGC system permease protein LptF